MNSLRKTFNDDADGRLFIIVGFFVALFILFLLSGTVIKKVKDTFNPKIDYKIEYTKAISEIDNLRQENEQLKTLIKLNESRCDVKLESLKEHYESKLQLEDKINELLEDPVIDTTIPLGNEIHHKEKVGSVEDVKVTPNNIQIVKLNNAYNELFGV